MSTICAHGNTIQSITKKSLSHPTLSWRTIRLLDSIYVKHGQWSMLQSKRYVFLWITCTSPTDNINDCCTPFSYFSNVLYRFIFLGGGCHYGTCSLNELLSDYLFQRMIFIIYHLCLLYKCSVNQSMKVCRSNYSFSRTYGMLSYCINMLNTFKLSAITITLPVPKFGFWDVIQTCWCKLYRLERV